MTTAIPLVFLLGSLVGACAGWMWWFADVRDMGRALVHQAARTAELRALLVATVDQIGNCDELGRPSDDGTCGRCRHHSLCQRVAKAVAQ